jgi:predicted metalloprotease with PDZ domain
MRKLSACLLAATLGLTPAFADAPADRWERVERVEWSSSQGRLGVMVMSMTPELRQYFNAPSDAGVLVVKVQPGSAAASAGIKVGDVLTNVRGEKIDDAGDVIAALSTTKQGDKIAVQLVRDKKQMSIDATMSNASSPPLSSWLRQAFPWLDFDQLARSTVPRPSSST